MKLNLYVVCQEEQALSEKLAQEKSTLLDEKEDSMVRIKELEEDLKTLAQRTVERETEMERSGVVIVFPPLCVLSFHSSIMKSLCVQDERKSKEGWNSERRRRK